MHRIQRSSRMTGIDIVLDIVPHVFLFANILLKTPLFLFFISLGFYVSSLAVLPEILINLLAFITRISSHTRIAEASPLFHVSLKQAHPPYIRPVLKNICCNNIFAVHTDLYITSELSLGIPHMVIFHVHKCGIHICFGITVTAPET